MLYVNPETALSFSGKAMAPGSKGRDEKVLREYEQLFIYQMLKEMRKTVPDYGVVDGSQRAHFDEMLDDFLAGEMAKSGQFGIAKDLAAQIALQESSAALLAASREKTEGIPRHKAVQGIPTRGDLAPGIQVQPPRQGIAVYQAVSLKPLRESKTAE